MLFCGDFFCEVNEVLNVSLGQSQLYGKKSNHISIFQPSKICHDFISKCSSSTHTHVQNPWLEKIFKIPLISVAQQMHVLVNVIPQGLYGGCTGKTGGLCGLPQADAR